MDSKEYMPIWRKKSILIGSPTNILAAITAFIPVLYLCIRYNCWPNPKFVLEAWGMLLISFGAFYVVEPVSYYAALGMSGTYLSFLSGNIGNMRVPCAALGGFHHGNLRLHHHEPHCHNGSSLCGCGGGYRFACSCK